MSEADRARMTAALQSSMMGFRQDLLRELASICHPFNDLSETGPRWLRYARAYEAWSRSATQPRIVANVYILRNASGKPSTLFRLNPTTGQFEPSEWPAKLRPLAERLKTGNHYHVAFREWRAPIFGVVVNGGARVPENRLQGPVLSFHSGNPATALSNLPRDPNGFYRSSDHGEFTTHPPLPHAFASPWAIEQNIPALIHPIAFPHFAGGPQGPVQLVPLDWLIVELDSTVLKKYLLPELAERYFRGPDGLDYQVAVVSGSNRIIYSSSAGFGSLDIAGADATLNLLGGPPGSPPPPPGGGGLLSSSIRSKSATAISEGERREFGFGLFRLDTIHYSAQEKDWQLAVKNRKGSLNAVVAAMRRRNLIVSFGILLVLAATMAMIIVATQRAHRLAQLQLEFVTGVSHELRTPLSVISSAADNMADGLIDKKQQVMQYGTVIKKQARQLNQLVEQILLFAATRQNRLEYHCAPVSVTELMDAALISTAELIHGAGFSVERNAEPGLPEVMGDLPALSQCLQNLITNAVKYGGQDRWLGIRAYTEEDSGKYVRISIDDHGMGIEPSELPHLFEPFYRSPAVTAAQIHGSGLGLPLARSMAEAMGGRLTAASEPGMGSSFTLHLRAVRDSASAPAGTGDTSVASPFCSSQHT